MIACAWFGASLAVAVCWSKVSALRLPKVELFAGGVTRYSRSERLR
ncbi:MAG: hypothetical protein QOG06_448 [Gaiellaceae bacterium]|jgi:hypothetical protein|nr:hypothetical protein [Gaiellaceae bacterium]